VAEWNEDFSLDIEPSLHSTHRTYNDKYKGYLNKDIYVIYVLKYECVM